MSFSSAVRIFGVLLVAAAQGGCFKPLLAGAEGSRLDDELSAIKIEPIPDRMGHYLANELTFAFSGSGLSGAPKYRLQVNLNQKVQTPVIDTVSGRASAASFMVDAEYRLMPVSSNNTITSGVAFTLIGYDRTSQRYSNMRAGRDAEVKAARALAEQIRLKLISDISSSR